MSTPSALAALALALAGPAQAQFAQEGLGIGLATEYDINPTLTPNDHSGLWRLSLTPSYALTRVSGPDEWHARLGLLLEQSSDTSLSASRQDPSLSLAWSRQAPKDTYSITAGYSESSTRVSEFQGGGSIATDASQYSRTLGASWRHELDERDALSLSAGLSDLSYSSGGFTDYRNLSLGASLSRAINERTDVFLNFSASRYLPAQDGVSSRSCAATAGINLRMSDRLVLSANLGANRTSSQTGDTESWQGGLGLNYVTDAKTAWTLDLSRNTTPSGLGGFETADQIKGSWSHALSENVSVGVDLSWRDNQTIASNQLSEISARISRALSPSWSVQASYRYRERQDDVQGTGQAHVLAVSLSYNNPDYALFGI